MSDLFLETNLDTNPLTPLEDKSEVKASPCFECGNCCRNIYGRLPVQDIFYFIERGYDPHICTDRYQFDSIKAFSKDYPNNLYIFSEHFGPQLESFMEAAIKVNKEDITKFDLLEIEFLMVGECINHDPETNMCSDYENRPQLCRQFPLGGDGCQNIRSKYHLPEIPLTQIADDHMIIK